MNIIIKCLLGCAITISSMAYAGKKEDAVVYVMKSPVQFSEDSKVPGNVKKECKLGQKLANFIRDYGEDYDVPVKFEGDKELPAGAVKLTLAITDAVAGGNAITGHRKFVSVMGSIPGADGADVTFEALRVSGGGMFGAFKGNCAVLGRTTKPLGKDIAKWLRKPKNGAELGDL